MVTLHTWPNQSRIVSTRPESLLENHTFLKKVMGDYTRIQARKSHIILCELDLRLTWPCLAQLVVVSAWTNTTHCVRCSHTRERAGHHCKGIIYSIINARNIVTIAPGITSSASTGIPPHDQYTHNMVTTW